VRGLEGKSFRFRDRGSMPALAQQVGIKVTIP